ncbi:hypothetical protein SLEP1_g357 [Rubroshorea leprosula]|uniref:COP1-interacting protein 7 n=1 Tax=Rubroshorea leprosula TaxID=152421 RepID=A0AAV5HA50_9ROSI|nr:hypothetical protein SLEP1_g357 [Rubroshorea leprosula]
MKTSTRLDSAVFQLTPTRTRCDLVIFANGKTEKLAYGLLNPFLAHLKTAQDQMSKGGYSITLQPGPGIDATWFTKGTVERFVRFVSTPEILERVYTVESEILQIEEAIAIQSNNNIGLSPVDGFQAKASRTMEGSKSPPDSNMEKAIVLYTPGTQTPEANGSAEQEGNSKVQLLKVLETRKTVLQKEQGMAFARAVAAGFEIDHMAPLISFAESFGASRLKDACLRFVELWKRKHETGQWLEIEAAEAMSSQSEFSAMNASGIMLANAINKQRESWPGTTENNGKESIDQSTDEKHLMDHQPPGHQEYFQGQFPHPLFPPWPIQSPPGSLPAFQGYPMQGMPYYQNYPGNGPFFHQPYPSMDDPRYNSGHRMRQKRHSMDSRDGHTGSETWEMEKGRSQDDEELDNETLESHEPRKKGSPSVKKKAGMVVIRNINYISSKKQNSSDSDSESASSTETDAENEDLEAASPKGKPKKSMRSSKGNRSQSRSLDTLNSPDKDDTQHHKEADGGQWQAFQNYLLRDAEDERRSNQGMFAMEKDVRVKRRTNAMDEDLLVYDGRGTGQFEEDNTTDIHGVSAKIIRMPKASNDQFLISQRGGQSADGRVFIDGQMDLQSREIDGRSGYRRTENDDFVVNRRENLSGFTGSPSDPLAVNGFERSNNGLERRSSHNVKDDSYIVPFRSTTVAEVGTGDRDAIDMDSEFPLLLHKAENETNGINHVDYEPDELSMLPERGAEKGSIGYDPALDYEIEAYTKNGASVDKKNKEVMTDNKQGLKKSDKDRKSKPVTDKNIGPIRKGKSSKLSPLDEARARAERLRTYKSDLQKMKKEKEEAEMKRLEALKLERQKRIAARGSSIPVQSAAATTQQTRKQLPSKLSLSSHKGSKFSDSEPGVSSALQRSIRPASLGSNDSQKGSKTGKPNTGTQSSGNRLSQSVSSLPDPKKESSGATPDTKSSMARIRRLSEPKLSTSSHVPSMKRQSSEPSSKPKISSGPGIKKISAIMNHDKSKIASLPELKIRKSEAPNAAASQSGAKEMAQKVNGSKSSSTEVAEMNRKKEKVSLHGDGDESTVIEKTVVMLECQKPAISALPSSEETMPVQKEQNDIHKLGKTTEIESDYAAIYPPVSPPNKDRIDKEPIEHQIQQQTGSFKFQVEMGNMSNAKKESLHLSGIGVTERAYQAPYARVSSLEDPCAENSEYGKGPPTGLQIAVTDRDTVNTHVSNANNLRLEKIPEALEKPQIKESKGFRRLLKFGRKNHNPCSSERNVESDNGSVYGSEADDLAINTSSSSEVHTLKNLISQDETPSGAGTPQKPSRHFSLLSPFKSKTRENKSTT